MGSPLRLSPQCFDISTRTSQTVEAEKLKARRLCFRSWAYLHGTKAAALCHLDTSGSSVEGCKLIHKVTRPTHVAQETFLPFVGIRPVPGCIVFAWVVNPSLFASYLIRAEGNSVCHVADGGRGLPMWPSVLGNSLLQLPKVKPILGRLMKGELAQALGLDVEVRSSVTFYVENNLSLYHQGDREALRLFRNLVLLIWNEISLSQAIAGLEELPLQLRLFQVQLRQLPPLLALTCVRLAIQHTQTMVVMSALCQLRSESNLETVDLDGIDIFNLYRQVSLRLYAVLKRLEARFDQQLRKGITTPCGFSTVRADSSDSSDSSDTSDSSDSDSDTSDSGSDSSDSSDSDSSDYTDSSNDSDSFQSDTAGASLSACPICLETECVDPCTLPCSHTFCRTCIADWTSRCSRCPMCNCALV
ncbi:MAG: hypothetical protein MHM6MM_006870 [Cercozoa sp. M6MM]